MSFINDFKLHDQKILITGASSGLGREIAVACSEVGANVALVGRNDAALQETMALMKKGEHYSYICDVTDGFALGELFNAIKNDMGPISGFVHSAGIELTLPLKANSIEKYRNILDVNLIAALELSRYVVKKKYRDEKVSIIFISSIMGIVGSPALTAYSASKGALIASSRSAAMEYADKGVRFNCISPGHIDGTKMAYELFDKLSPEAKNDLVLKHPLGLGKPRDVGNASVFLLSNASSWITGINLVVDGGYSAQ